MKMKAFSLLGLAWVGAGIGFAQEPLQITALHRNGELLFEDEPDIPSGYQIQWAPTVQGPWYDSWENLSFLLKPAGDGSVSITVPMFYRVIRMDSFAALPEPVVDEDYYDGGEPDEDKVELGRLLFFDKILSGNRNISCATCHHPMAGTGDGLSLPVGEGGAGLGVIRDLGTDEAAVVERVPRNAPPVFNLGAREFEVMFHDGRVQVNDSLPQGFSTPAGDRLPPGLDNVLAAQAMFPVTSATEMAGQEGENDIADLAAADDLPGIWAALAERLKAVPEYVERFIAVYDDVTTAEEITYVHAANAIAAFEAAAWRADQSPFDHFLRGNRDALSSKAFRGMQLFYGKASCSGCHSGKFQTDQAFRSICFPQVGPGKGDGESGREDFGRERVTKNPEDRYRFRTPSLRNVALTAPYGHDGAFNTLQDMIRHHMNPSGSLASYDPAHFLVPSRADLDALDLFVYNTRNLEGDANRWSAILEANDLPTIQLTEEEVSDLIEFLHALTDPVSVDLRKDFPKYIPSGLPLFD